MAYNTSKETVKRMEAFLRRMFDVRGDIEWAHKSPSSLAYKIREAIHAASHHEEYSHYAQLADMYTIKARAGTVKAEFVKGVPLELGSNNDGPKEVVEKKEEPPKILNIPDATNLHGVIGAAIKYKGAHEAYFPEAVLMPSEMVKLYAWAQESGWKIIAHEDKGITLTKREVDPDLVYTPEEK